jgi:hypothetical protein
MIENEEAVLDRVDDIFQFADQKVIADKNITT